MKRVVVVGSSLAGLRAAQTLRAEGFDGELTVVGAETHAPYDRPPLSKDFLLGKVAVADIALADDAALAELGACWLLGRRATALRPGRVGLDGEELPADGVVIATGARARTSGASSGLAGVHVLRTLDDAAALRDGLTGASRVAVVGAGFIGTEVASTAVALGARVTIVEPQALPLGQALGSQVAERLVSTIREHGVELRTGVGVAGIAGNQHVTHLELDDGSRVEADLVVVGVGAVPNTEWLDGSGVICGNGVLTDAWGRTNRPGVVAAGDVACADGLRVEHWTNARDMPVVAARTLLADAAGAEAGAPHRPAPYVWSEQFGHRIQMVGRVRAGVPLDVVEGALGEAGFVAVQRVDDAVTAVVGWSMPREFTRRRRHHDADLRATR